MTGRLQYLLHLNILVMEAQNTYQKAKNSRNQAYVQSALFKLKAAQDALNSYCRQLIREGVTPTKTVSPELFQ